jgi:hypothetical protein
VEHFAEPLSRLAEDGHTDPLRLVLPAHGHAEARPGVAEVGRNQRHQLEVIARVTPHSMAAHLLNTTVMAIAVAGSVPRVQLICWCVYSYAIALLILYRHARSHGRVPRNFPRAARRATVYAFLLALPWSAVAVLYLGSLPHDKELICRSASKLDPPSARDSAKPSGATLRCAPPALALRPHNLEGGQLFDADPGQMFGAV